MKARTSFALLLVALFTISLLISYSAAQEPATDPVAAELEANEYYRQNPPRRADDIGRQERKVTTPEAILYFSDFEGNNGGFAGTLDWEWGTYAWAGTCTTHYEPPTAYSGTDMWGTVLNECYNNLGNNAGYDTCVNGNPADDSILSFSVDLTGVTDPVEMSWWEWYDLFMDSDWGEVYVNGNVVFQHCGTGYVIPSAWEQQVVDLTPYVGGIADIEFHMMASTVVERAGWYIDDLMVYTAAAGPDIGVIAPPLEAALCPGESVSLEFSICNTGMETLQWTLGESATGLIYMAASEPVAVPELTGVPTVPAGSAQEGPIPGAPPTDSAPANAPLVPPAAPASPESVLWDQPLSAVNQGAYANQDFETANDAYDIFIADDFDTAGEWWAVDTLFVPGNTWNAGCDLTCADSLTWMIFADGGGVPDGDPYGGGNPPVWVLNLPPTDPAVTITTGTGGYLSNVTLDHVAFAGGPLVLPPGQYWLVFYPSMELVGCCQYGRQPSDTTNGYAAQVINPGGGFNFPTTWTSVQVPATWGLLQQDFAFRIEGEVLPGVPWLSLDPTAGAVLPGECMTVEVTFDSQGMSPGDYFASLIIESNDPDEPEITLPVTLTVRVPPIIDVTPMALETVTCPGDMEFLDLEICNLGECTLDWYAVEISATAELAGSASIEPAGVALEGPVPEAPLTDSAPARGPLVTPAAPASPEAVLWDQPLSITNTDTYANQDFEAIYDGYDIFIADDFANDGWWAVDTLFVVGNTWNLGCDLDCAGTLNWHVYADAGGVPAGDPWGGGDPPLWAMSLPPDDPRVTLGAGIDGFLTNVTLTLDIPLYLPPDTYWLLFYPSLSLTDCGCQSGRQVADTTNGNAAQVINPGGGFGFPATWTSIQDPAAWGMAQQDLAFRLEGEVLPDVPWLSLDPAAGTVDPDECMTPEATLDATGLLPGDYYADLLLVSNDPAAPVTTVPVTLTVLTPVDIEGLAFTWSPEMPLAGEPVDFSATEPLTGTPPFTYIWDFGDGFGDVGQNVSHAYGAADDYEVTLTVENACASASITGTVTVELGLNYVYLPIVVKDY